MSKKGLRVTPVNPRGAFPFSATLFIGVPGRPVKGNRGRKQSRGAPETSKTVPVARVRRGMPRKTHVVQEARPTRSPGHGCLRPTFREEAMIINHNMSAIFADRQLKLNDLLLSKSMEKLSSGSRITRAGDDASGLAVSEKMRSPDPRPAPGQLQRRKRHLLHPDHRGIPPGEPGHHPEAARALRAGGQRHLHRRGQDADPGRGLRAGQRGGPHRLSRPVQRHEHAHGPLRPPGRGQRHHRLHVAADRGQHGPAHPGVHRHHDRRGPGHEEHRHQADHLSVHPGRGQQVHRDAGLGA